MVAGLGLTARSLSATEIPFVGESRDGRCTVNPIPPFISHNAFGGKTAMAAPRHLRVSLRSAEGSKLLSAFPRYLPTCEGPALAAAGPTSLVTLRQAATAKNGLDRPRLAA